MDNHNRWSVIAMGLGLLVTLFVKWASLPSSSSTNVEVPVPDAGAIDQKFQDQELPRLPVHGNEYPGTTPAPNSKLKDGEREPGVFNLWRPLWGEYVLYGTSFIVLGFLAHAAWVIMRFPNNPWPWSPWLLEGGGGGRREIHQVPTKLPFIFKLAESTTNTLGRFSFNLQYLKNLKNQNQHQQAQCPETPEAEDVDINIQLLWAVDASHLFKLINGSWAVLFEEDVDGTANESDRDQSDHVLDGENGLHSADSTPTSTSNANAKPYFHLERVHVLKTDPDQDSDGNQPEAVVSGESGIENEDKDYVKYKVDISSPENLRWESLTNQYKYPLAIFISQGEKAMKDNQNREEYAPAPIPNIIGLCIIIHVKNSLIVKPTEVLAQYIKLSSGQVHHLQSLYVMDTGIGVGDGDEDDDDDKDKKNIEENLHSQKQNSQTQSTDSDCDPGEGEVRERHPFNNVVCSVCQTYPVSRAIIPCRHVCLCALCFEKLSRCPICRGAITAYFKTRSEAYVQDIQRRSQSQDSQSIH